MATCVRSEIGALKKVLLQRPGKELEHLSPSTMEQLLFDDIPYLHRAQQEHDEFAGLLRSCGAEVVYLDELTAQTLASDPALQLQFTQDAVMQAGNYTLGYRYAVLEYLSSINDPLTLVRKIMAGVPYREVFPSNRGRLADVAGSHTQFVMPPIPNLYFTRDPFACIGKGVCLNRMHSATRHRETLFGKYILQYHPDFAGQVPLYYHCDNHFSIEGGDILNLSKQVLAVGISQRTQPEAIQQLAKNLFAREDCPIDTVLAFDIPKNRAFMHLDTVFTQIDRDKFTVHPKILHSLRVYELTGKRRNEIAIRELELPMDQILAQYLGLDRVQLIRCGGESEIAADREQWNDGSNTLCVAPGSVIVYDRNYVTNQILEDSGIQIYKMSSSELSRGRGGPRCMSMPLVRASIHK